MIVITYNGACVVLCLGHAVLQLGVYDNRRGMAAPLSAEFAALDGATKVHTLMALVRQCAYQEQMQFVEELQNLLHKDFLTHLPADLSEKIISYLSMDDVLNCLLVCKSWNRVVSGCSSYWQSSANNIGLSPLFLEERITKYKGVKGVCISALNHQKYVRSLVPRSIVVARSLATSSSSYMYAGNGIALRYKELNAHAQIVIERMNTPHSMVELTSFTMTAFSSRVKWVAASNNYILWKQIDGKWNGYDLSSSDSERERWDDEPVSQGFHSISFCHKCHLVGIGSEAEDDCEVWDLQVIKLIEGTSTARKMVYPLPLERIQKLGEKKRHFLGGKVIILPEKGQKDRKGFCCTHRVLLQVDNIIAVHRLQSLDETEHLMVVHQLLPDARLSKPLYILRAQAEQHPLDPDVLGSRGPPAFCMSADQKRIGVMHDSYLYVWNLESYKEESCVDLINLNLPTDTKCIALGSVYAVLASNSWGFCVVIVTRTGEVLLHGSLDETTFDPSAYRTSRFSFYPPLRQEWLNSFDYFDFWPLALAFDQYASANKPNDEQELLAVVGVRSCHKKALSGML